jgi:hypothetical protein
MNEVNQEALWGGEVYIHFLKGSSNVSTENIDSTPEIGGWPRPVNIGDQILVEEGLAWFNPWL